MKNRLGFLGLLGLLGILGFTSHHLPYLFFFSFFIFFRFFWVIPDELFRENVKKSATPAFFTSLVLYVLTVASGAFYSNGEIYMDCLVICFAVSFLVFFGLLAFYQFHERRGARA